MSRSCKTGLDYFPFDVDFFNDEKIEFTSAKYGIKGEIIAVKLLSRIYRNGYFIKWGSDESLLFSKRAGDEISQSDVDNVINELIKRHFFDEDVYKKYNILTSSGIQKRYFEATKRRKKVNAAKEYLLVDVSDYNVDIIELNVDINKQSKGKESKGKESKVKERKVKERKVKERKELYDSKFKDFWTIYPKRNGKKIGKADTKTKFEKIKIEELDSLLTATKNYADSKGVKDGYAKDPERFFVKNFWKEWIEPEEVDGEKESLHTKDYHEGVDTDGSF